MSGLSAVEESQNQDQEFSYYHEDGPKRGVNYYKESCRLYYFNCILYNNYEKVLNERNELKSKLAKFQTLESEFINEDSEQMIQDLEDKRKRSRRSAAEILRNFNCQVQNCNKAYGSEGSLLQHMKLKHPELLEAQNE